MFTADRGTAGNRWPVVRLRAGSKSEVVLLSRSFFCVTTHWDRCTVLCSVDGCPLCDLLPSRGLFYVAAMCAGRVSLVELGALSASNLEQHCKLLHAGMNPGQVLELSRRTSKSPVYSECVRVQAGASEISTIDLATHVLALYKFPPPNPGELIEGYEVRIRQACRRRNELAAQRLLKSRREGVESR